MLNRREFIGAACGVATGLEGYGLAFRPVQMGDEQPHVHAVETAS